jgi:dethiobiotin synthetase
MSGFDMATAAVSDAGVLLDALGELVTSEAIDRISPWRFAAPLSPDMAAAREGRSIDFDALVEHCRREIAATRGTLLIEGVGGVMVPLDERHTVLDWMEVLGLPLILVTGNYLGAISHTLTAIDACKRRALDLAALVVNASECSPVSMEETVATLWKILSIVSE